MNNKGQAVVSEYVMIFFVVIAAVVAMTVSVKRVFQARIHDANVFMIDSVVNSGACDANCMNAAGITGSQIPYEYEPYYAQMLADVANSANDVALTGAGSPAVIGVKFYRTTNEQASTVSTSTQLPASCADGVVPLPSWCGS